MLNTINDIDYNYEHQDKRRKIARNEPLNIFKMKNYVGEGILMCWQNILSYNPNYDSIHSFNISNAVNVFNYFIDENKVYAFRTAPLDINHAYPVLYFYSDLCVLALGSAMWLIKLENIDSVKNGDWQYDYECPSIKEKKLKVTKINDCEFDIEFGETNSKIAKVQYYFYTTIKKKLRL